MLGGYTALAESEWMGVAQASDVLEPLHVAAPRRRRAVVPRLPRLRFAGLLRCEFTIAEASFVLMASFFLSALLGQAAFPRLSAHVTVLEWSRMRRTLLRALAVVVALAIAALLGLIFLGRPTISIPFEHDRFDAAAGSLTYTVLIPYVVALPAYVATEVITRGLIALRDTRTLLLTNSAQFTGRAAIIVLLLRSIGVLVIPVASAVTASVKTVALGVVLLLKLQRRMRLGAAVAH
jgi:peptidoglycan biosynthesis protein MviN/MurJ (putative lipid II flippase)